MSTRPRPTRPVRTGGHLGGLAATATTVCLLLAATACGSATVQPTAETPPTAAAALAAPSPVANSGGAGPNIDFASGGDVAEMIKFLTGPVMYTDNSQDSVTAGKQLAVSYYAVPKYWGGYICNPQTFPDNNCAYTIKPGGEPWHQWPEPSDNAAANLAYERADATAGADIYDIATWQIALALAAKDAANVPGVDPAALYSLIENQNQHLTDKKYRATPKTFKYGYTKEITDPASAFYFRMTPTDFLVMDPLATTEGKEYNALVTNDASVKAPDLGKTSWTDWKPITGENAWAWFLGPIHADALKNQAQGYIPFNSTSLQNAVKVLDAFSYMQTGIGAFYYATGGSLGNVGTIPEGEISVENNFSTLGGLRVLQAALQATKAKDPNADKAAIDAALGKIDVMLNGGQTAGGYHTDGLLSFIYNGAYDPAKGFFLQGGTSYPASAPAAWVPASSDEPWAVDVNTWGLAALGAATVDTWWGPGTAFKIWQSVRPWGGYFGPAADKSGPVWGVGYSNKDNNGIMSTEWTAGAINMLHMLVTYYTANPNGITPQQLQSLRADEQSMLTNIQKMRADNYASAGFNDAVPAEYLATPSTGQAYLYGSKRYPIPFGWFANPLPSTTSTAWPVMLHYSFNPFQPSGTYDIAALPKPASKNLSGGGKPTQAPSGPLTEDVTVTVVNQVDGASIAVNYQTTTNPNFMKAADVPMGGTAPNVKLPAGTSLISISYNKPPGGSFWGEACNVTNPSSLSNGSTLTAIWTQSGKGACK